VTAPQLLEDYTEDEFREYYKREYCRNGVVTFDGIRVYFKESRFRHAFYESRRRDGQKDVFSTVRAQRMNWIRETLESPESSIFQGWDKKKKRYDPCRMVCVLYEEFVVVIAMKLKKGGVLTAEFVTCFQADNSIEKIRRSPRWSKEKCLEVFNLKGR